MILVYNIVYYNRWYGTQKGSDITKDLVCITYLHFYITWVRLSASWPDSWLTVSILLTIPVPSNVHYNHKFNVSILLTIPVPSNVHGIKLIFAVLLQIQLWRNFSLYNPAGQLGQAQQALAGNLAIWQSSNHQSGNSAIKNLWWCSAI